MKSQLGGALGRHVLLEAYGCNVELLDNVKSVEKIMIDAALSAGAEIREVAFHKFSPQGVSGVVVISESHLTIHTWPELGYAAIDVFTCGESVNPWDAVDYIIEKFEAESVTANEVKRGIFQSDAKVKVS
ncbi:S-adenosylmethionine decarboxylase proenzyme [Anoxybacter fermentans]|uniref:S-adenosylmethionine decarboxylase proenzyme n=1 Tax=Anoxybacter fermentans TaxID=1323375 RepID=A0A3Q9HR67_9FIRM|nr:adenosylmethionine decarboxylase [Anoxybacter fermentans]AZR73817.1 S-adenosylmethionine decarboxylase proenzyme [Anoxybacter fermentans]